MPFLMQFTVCSPRSRTMCVRWLAKLRKTDAIHGVRAGPHHSKIEQEKSSVKLKYESFFLHSVFPRLQIQIENEHLLCPFLFGPCARLNHCLHPVLPENALPILSNPLLRFFQYPLFSALHLATLKWSGLPSALVVSELANTMDLLQRQNSVVIP